MTGTILTITFTLAVISFLYGAGATTEVNGLRTEVVDLAARVLLLESRPK